MKHLKRRKQVKKHTKHSDDMERQDREMLFEMLKNYIDKWWD